VIIDSTGVHISALVLSWYGLFVVAGGLAGAVAAARLARRRGDDPEHVWSGLIPTLILGLVGARLWFILFPPQSVIANGGTPAWYLAHPLDLNQGFLAIWTGGFGLFGAIAGGVLGIALYTRLRKLPIAPWLDIAAVGLALGGAIARLGDGAAGDLYGPPAAWGTLIPDPALRVAPYTDLTRYPLDSTRFQPVFLYEAVLMAFIFVVMLILCWRGRPRQGDLVLLYAALYGAGRTLLESLRVNVSLVAGIDVSQATAGLLAVIAIAWLWRRHRRGIDDRADAD